MTYLEQLKKAVAEAFEGASDKATVDKMVNIQTAIKDVEQENIDLIAKNHELLTAYKEAIAHPGISKERPKDETTVEGSFTFEDYLANYKEK